MKKNEKPASDTSDVRARTERVIAMAELGIDKVDSIGLHGTSIQAIQHSIDYGVMPGGVIKDARGQYTHGDLFYYPLGGPTQPEQERKRIVREAEMYAGITARNHFTVDALHLDFGNAEQHFLAGEFSYKQKIKWSDEDVLNAFKRFVHIRLGGHGKKEDIEQLRDEVERVAKEAWAHKGVVIALSPRTGVDFEVKPGDPGEDDVRISCPSGLSLEYISGISSRGEREEEYISSLKKIDDSPPY
ncbi:MAG: hypothetical protein Q8P56_01865 [Candidatus Uhrbacteria bacterium]|nr:hypothetical protein [Candidatus Uhrbacteria bacterium]